MVSTFKFADYIVGVLIGSNIDNKLVQKMHEIILERLKENQKINLFIEIRMGSSISLAAFFKDQVFILKYAAQFQKIALRTNLVWFQNVMAVKDLGMSAAIRSFSNKNRMEAITWIVQ